jgi:hypothetical protein
MVGSLTWARGRGSKHLDRFLIGGLVLGVALAAASNWLVAPRDAAASVRFVYSIAAFGIAALAAIGTAYGWALLRAPYEQRDVLRETAIHLRSDIRAQSPDLFGTINTTVGGYISGNPTLFVHINVTVLNRGAPSVVRNWVVFVTVASVRRPVPLRVIGNTDMLMHDGGALHIDASDAIYEKGTARVETGAQISGWLGVQVAGVDREAFFQTGNVVEVAFEDFLGKAYTSTSVLGAADHGSAPAYVPGSNKPEAWRATTKVMGKRNRKRKRS